MKYFILFCLSLFLFSCSKPPDQTPVVSSAPKAADPSISTNEATPTGEETTSGDEPKYPGITIDQQFPIISEHSLSEEEMRNKKFDVDVLGLKVEVSNFAPIAIRKDSKVLVRFKTRSPKDYWSNLVGVSSLLGPKSKEIYVVSTGPGGVCCTNYWISDVSSGRPRIIFRSEEFGYFREPMEVFDADGDGVYELVQFDSCFRYFMDDCGSCSPEPRAVFKYDKKLGQYRPASGILQDFVKTGMADTEIWVREKFESLKKDDDVVGEYELRRTVISHFVDLLHIGAEKKAWAFFRTFYPNALRKEMKEIRFRLAHCQFYQALRKKDVRNASLRIRRRNKF